MRLVFLGVGARRARRLLLAGVVFAVLPTGSALARRQVVVLVGQTGGGVSCATSGQGNVFVDTSYVVPMGGGTIRSFSFQSDSSNKGEAIDFLALRPAGGSTFKLIGKTGPVALKGTG